MKSPPEPRRVIQSFSPRALPHYEQMSGRKSFLRLIAPYEAFRGRDERWMAEFAIENPGQERYFANKTAWWKLPRKYNAATLFVPQSACRVANDHLISVQVSGQQQGVLLRTPDLGSLFAALLVPGIAPAWAMELDPDVRESVGATLAVRSSDKGRYVRGVLGLFESLQKAAYVFEHDFWRQIIESLSSPVISEHTRKKVRADVERIQGEAAKEESEVEALVDEVLDAAGRIQVPTRYLNFGSLFERYRTYLQGLNKEEQCSEIIETAPRAQPTTEKQIRDAAYANLRQMLSELTARRFFLQGAEVQCAHCLSSLWYHVDDLQSLITCRGCRKGIDLPAEVPWSYALNELVVSAVRDHGVVPVIRTAYRLFEDSRECFCFLPGLEIVDYKENVDAQFCELDLVWIGDGEFGIAEVKRTPKKFSVSANFRKLLEICSPDRLLLVSPSGTKEQMEQTRSRVQGSITPSVNVEAWGQEMFGGTFRVGWNTVRYSVFP